MTLRLTSIVAGIVMSLYSYYLQVAAKFLAVMAVFTSGAQHPSGFEDLQLVEASNYCDSAPELFQTCFTADVSRY